MTYQLDLIFHDSSVLPTLQVHSGQAFDPDNPDHMKWVYDEVDYMNLLVSLQIDFTFLIHSLNTSI